MIDHKLIEQLSNVQLRTLDKVTELDSITSLLKRNVIDPALRQRVMLTDICSAANNINTSLKKMQNEMRG